MKGTTSFNGMKVFSATMLREREALGEVVTAWIAANPQCVVSDMLVRQSSDASFHCLSIIVLYFEAGSRPSRAARRIVR